MRHKSNNKTRPLFTLSLEMTRLVNETRLLLVPGVNSDIYGRLCTEFGGGGGALAFRTPSPIPLSYITPWFYKVHVRPLNIKIIYISICDDSIAFKLHVPPIVWVDVELFDRHHAHCTVHISTSYS